MTDFQTIRRALMHAERECPYHGPDFHLLGMQNGMPRCESCRQPWRIKQAREALDRIEVKVRA